MSRSHSHLAGRWPFRCGETAALRRLRSTTTSSTSKFRELVGPVLGAERTERLLATCWQFDDLSDVSELLAQTVPADG